MKTSHLKIFTLLLLLTSILNSPLTSFSQAKYHAQVLNMSVNGTSTLHDWEIKSDKGQFDAMINFKNDIVSVSVLNFSLPAESLKSGHGAMDKNTYKALSTDKNPNISFALTSANVTPSGTNTYQFKGTGKLTIAGTTKSTEISGTLKYNPADKSFLCTGTKTFKMTEYGVKPPTVMMGAIKTGDEISISYNMTIRS